MALSHFAISKAAPKPRPYKISDGSGLHLLVEPNGSKKWRFRYRFGGREKMIALGTYPATSLADARAKRDSARSVLEAGKDPSAERKESKAAALVAAASTFGVVAAEVLANKEANEAANATLSNSFALRTRIVYAQRGRIAAQIGVDVVERRVPVSLKEGQELRLAFRHHGLHGLARAVQDGVASKSRNSFDASHTRRDIPDARGGSAFALKHGEERWLTTALGATTIISLPLRGRVVVVLLCVRWGSGRSALPGRRRRHCTGSGGRGGDEDTRTRFLSRSARCSAAVICGMFSRT